MPEYSFINKKGEVKEFYFSMADAPRIGETVKILNKNWTRIIENPPNASFDSQLSPWDAKGFVERTGKSSDTYGAILERSEEMSNKRAEQNGGKDPVKEQYQQEYSKKRNGRGKVSAPKLDEAKLTKQIMKDLSD